MYSCSVPLYMTAKSDQSLLLRTVVGRAITDKSFRSALRSNVRNTIDSKKGELGFGSDALTPGSIEILTSITPQEFDMLENLYERASKEGVKPVEMF